METRTVKRSLWMFLLGIGIVVMIAVVAGDFKTPKQTASLADAVPKNSSENALNKPNEILVEKLEEGTGKPAASGDKITVHYTGRLEDGTVFDSSIGRNMPFEFVVGGRTVIPCWDQGLIGAKSGSKLRLTCPPLAAYGETGVPNVIPPNAVLTFDVEVLSINNGQE